MKRLGPLLLLVGALAPPGFAPAGSASDQAPGPQPRARLPAIAAGVVSPVRRTLLGLSHSPAAERERVFIRKLIAQGKTKDEIEDALVAEYGGQVLAMPENRGIDVWAYAIPVIGLVLGLLGGAWAIIAWRRRRPDPEDEQPSEAPSEDEADRLEKDMARFDL